MAKRATNGLALEILDTLSEAVYALDPTFRFTYANAAALGLWRKPASAVLGRHLLDAFPEATGSEPWIMHERAAAERRVIEVETRSSVLDRWLSVTIYPAPVGLVVHFRDITEQRHAREALRELNATLERRVEERTRELDHIFRLSLDVLLVSDFDGRVRSVSPAWERITGFPVESLLLRPFMDFVHPDDRARTAAEFKRLLHGNLTLQFENRYRHAEGTWRSMSWRAVPAPDQRLIYATARDVTAERAQEERLRQTQKLEALGQLTGGIAHDFNNLLTAVLGNLELAHGRVGADTTLAGALDGATRAAQRGADLVAQLLAFARGRQETAAVRVNDLIRGMTEFLDRAVGPTVSLRHELDDDAGSIVVNVSQLENALLNLVINARDAMPTGGTITISTRALVLGADHPELAPGDYVELAVSDTGIGVAPELAPRLFEPFFTTKAGKGTGLGLSQVYALAQQSGGAAQIDSEPGRGCRVTLMLPRTRETAKPVPASRTALRTEPIPASVMVVDDDPDVLPAVVASLQSLGFATTAAPSGAAALELIEQNEPDVVVVDLGMPEMNGAELVERLRARRPHLPIVLTTGQANAGSLSEFSGVPPLLRKPFRVSELVDALTAAIEIASEAMDS